MAYIVIDDKMHEKIKLECELTGEKISRFSLKVFEEYFAKGTKESLELGYIVDILQKLTIKDRLEVTKQLHESAKLSAKLEEVNKSLMESVA